jgi:hypothetical protein
MVFGNGFNKYNGNLRMLMVLVIESLFMECLSQENHRILGSISVFTGPCSEQESVDVITYSE